MEDAIIKLISGLGWPGAIFGVFYLLNKNGWLRRNGTANQSSQETKDKFVEVDRKLKRATNDQYHEIIGRIDRIDQDQRDMRATVAGVINEQISQGKDIAWIKAKMNGNYK